MSSSFRRPARQRQPQDLNAPLVVAVKETSESGQDVTTSTESNQRSSVLSRLPGTKPWTNGITLTSVGVRDVDSILGGGQPLGTCILVEEDRWTLDFGLSLVRYWCAEVRCVFVIKSLDGIIMTT
jgi:hypothetical protein